MAARDGLGQLTEHRSVLGRYTVRDRTRDPGITVEVDVFDRLAGLVADVMMAAASATVSASGPVRLYALLA